MEKNREYVRRIMIAVNSIDGMYDMGAKWSGVKSNTLTLLYALDDDKPHTQKSVCQEWLIPKTTINTIIKECKEEGYITLEPMEGRKKELQICLTEEGRSFARKHLNPLYEAENKAIEKTLKECSPQFISQLELFCDNLREELDKCML